MSNKDGPPSPFTQYPLWSGMASNIVSLIMSTALSLSQEPAKCYTLTESNAQEMINQFSQDTNNFLKRLDKYPKPQTKTKHLEAPKCPKRELKPVRESWDKGIATQDLQFRNKMNTCNNGDVNVSCSKKGRDEETAHLCIIKEETSEVSDYSLDPVTKKIKISTVEEYSKLATCTVIKNRGTQADDEEEVGGNSNQETLLGLNGRFRLEELKEEEEPSVEEQGKIEQDSEPCEELVLENEEIISFEIKPTEKVISEDTASAEAVLIKKLTDALNELRNKTSIAPEIADLSYKISQTSISEGLEDSLVNKIIEKLSKLEEVNKDLNEIEERCDTSEKLQTGSIEEAVLKRINEKLADLKSSQPPTSSISVNTIEKFPEPVKRTDKFVEAEPELADVYTQNTQTEQIKRAISKVEVKQKPNIKRTSTTSEESSNKSKYVIKAVKSKGLVNRTSPSRRSGAGAADVFERLYPKRKSEAATTSEANAQKYGGLGNKKEHSSKTQIRPTNNLEENRRRSSSKNRSPAKR